MSARDTIVYAHVQVDDHDGPSPRASSRRSSAPSTARTSRPSNSGDEEEEDDDEVGSPMSCVPALLQEAKDRVSGAEVRDLRRSYFLGTLALWHTYGVWLAACVDIGAGLVLLVRWYVGWLQFSMVSCSSPSSPFAASCCLHFFAVFLRSFILISVVSELSRFCFWLGRDAWRDDAFEAYRRALLGQGRAEIELGALYGVGWSASVVRGRLRLLDALAQCLIYFSFDVVPLLCGAVALRAEGASPGSAGVAVFQALGVVSIAHVLLFFLAWTATDLRLKALGFRQALRGGHDFTLDAEQVLTECMQDELQRSRDQSDEQEALLMEAALTTHSHEALQRFAADKAASAVGPGGGGGGPSPGSLRRPARSVADRLSLCAPLRSLLHLVAPHVPWPLLMLLGLAAESWSLILSGLLLGVVAILYSYGKTTHARTKLRRLPQMFSSEGDALWALQAWGDVCCGLEHSEQMKRRVTFAKIVMFQILLFVLMGWWSYVAICLFLLAGVVVRQGMLFGERPYGWLAGIIEGLLQALGTALLCLAFPTSEGWKSPGPSLGIFLLAAARQFGLARASPDCYRVMHAVSLILTVATLLIVGVVLYASVTFQSKADYTQGSSFCHPEDPQCAYYSVPYVPEDQTQSLTCPAWFSVGARGREFSLSDFALLAWIAYEPQQTMYDALQRYFPGWQVVHAHWAANHMRKTSDAASGAADDDWTTFFEYASPDNATSVFSIRGTHNAVDALNDIILWTPAVVTQVFSLLGPDTVPSVQVAVGSLISFFEGRHAYEFFFEELLEYVRRRQREDPGREYFVTGHSLGGGLAKLVAAKSGLRAVTFMAPGLSMTSHVVYRNFSGDILRGTEVLTLQPQYDIVSRLDMQTGLVVPIGCTQASGLYCHLIGPALCEVFRKCGSGRPNETLSMPCGACDLMPCPSATGSPPPSAAWPWPTVSPPAASSERAAAAAAPAAMGFEPDSAQ